MHAVSDFVLKKVTTETALMLQYVCKSDKNINISICKTRFLYWEVTYLSLGFQPTFKYSSSNLPKGSKAIEL